MVINLSFVHFIYILSVFPKCIATSIFGLVCIFLALVLHLMFHSDLSLHLFWAPRMCSETNATWQFPYMTVQISSVFQSWLHHTESTSRSTKIGVRFRLALDKLAAIMHAALHMRVETSWQVVQPRRPWRAGLAHALFALCIQPPGDNINRGRSCVDKQVEGELELLRGVLVLSKTACAARRGGSPTHNYDLDLSSTSLWPYQHHNLSDCLENLLSDSKVVGFLTTCTLQGHPRSCQVASSGTRSCWSRTASAKNGVPQRSLTVVRTTSTKLQSSSLPIWQFQSAFWFLHYASDRAISYGTIPQCFVRSNLEFSIF